MQQPFWLFVCGLPQELPKWCKSLQLHDGINLRWTWDALHCCKCLFCMAWKIHQTLTGLCGGQVSTHEEEQGSHSHVVNKKKSQFHHPNVITMTQQVGKILPSIGAIESSSACGNQVEEATPISIQCCFSIPLYQGSSLCGYCREGPYDPQSNEALLPLLPLPMHLTYSSNGMSKDYNYFTSILFMPMSIIFHQWYRQKTPCEASILVLIPHLLSLILNVWTQKERVKICHLPFF